LINHPEDVLVCIQGSSSVDWACVQHLPNVFVERGVCFVHDCHAEVEYLGYSSLWLLISISSILAPGGQSSIQRGSQTALTYILKRYIERGTPFSAKKTKQIDIDPSLRIIKQYIK
jgi:hypothetical protein